MSTMEKQWATNAAKQPLFRLILAAHLGAAYLGEIELVFVRFAENRHWDGV